MTGQIYHVGLTVTDMDRSIEFYRDVLQLKFIGEIFMEGPETDAMFRMKDCKCRVAYLTGSDDVKIPPVELIQFVGKEVKRQQSELLTTSISELCFYVEDIDAIYQRLIDHKVECFSAPQSFDFTSSGFGKSKAFYFRDPDGIILEMMQPVL